MNNADQRQIERINALKIIMSEYKKNELKP